MSKAAIFSSPLPVRPGKLLPVRRDSRIDLRHAPDTPAVLAMLNDLASVYPRALPALLSVSRQSVDSWLSGAQLPSRQCQRLIWFTWQAMLAKDGPRLGLVEVLTWGKIRVDLPQ